MRVLVMVKETERSEEGGLPSKQLIEDMGRFNQELIDAGVMVAAEGLLPSRRGKRLHFDATGRRKVLDGPFAEAKEIVGGFWIWEVESMEEALAWAEKMPCPHELRDAEEAIVEFRPISTPEDFADRMPQELIDQEAEVRKRFDERQA